MGKSEKVSELSLFLEADFLSDAYLTLHSTSITLSSLLQQQQKQLFIRQLSGYISPTFLELLLIGIKTTSLFFIKPMEPPKLYLSMTN